MGEILLERGEEGLLPVVRDFARICGDTAKVDAMTPAKKSEMMIRLQEPVKRLCLEKLGPLYKAQMIWNQRHN